MATVYGVNYTKSYQTTPPTVIDSALQGGKVRCIQDVYEASSLASGSTIYVAYPRKGWRWLGISKLITDAMGSAVTLAVGISGATTKFLAATSHASAAQSFCQVIGGLGYEFDGATPVIITTGGASATGTINVELYFSTAD